MLRTIQAVSLGIVLVMLIGSSPSRAALNDSGFQLGLDIGAALVWSDGGEYSPFRIDGSGLGFGVVPAIGLTRRNEIALRLGLDVAHDETTVGQVTVLSVAVVPMYRYRTDDPDLQLVVGLGAGYGAFVLADFDDQDEYGPFAPKHILRVDHEVLLRWRAFDEASLVIGVRGWVAPFFGAAGVQGVLGFQLGCGSFMTTRRLRPVAA